ncbi:uncharacterized protein LOC118419204 [Branchiostoma floridae]|uniref:Uncharacterized protein LOC118419204 n=1 Tax=Branchiostoma floridae TaxID=7739 RepID=A0A9J7LEP8_BRAFL|nr:uncharacterized protein LOC118419204 [Branchiostoma floridae]
MEKGRLRKDVGKFNMALALYMAAKVRCDNRDQGEGIEHRYEYTEWLLQEMTSKWPQGKEQKTAYQETTTPAKVAGKFQDLDKRWTFGGDTESVLLGYAQLMVEGIVNDNSMLEAEASKSLGDVYLKRGTETRDTRDLTRATALYNKALERCHNAQGTVALVHRVLHTAKIRQKIITIKKNRSTRTRRQHDMRGRKDHFSTAPSSDMTNDGMPSVHIAAEQQDAEREVEEEISYHKHLHAADRDFANGDLDAAEQNLAAALKLVHDPGKPDKAREADCLCRLGDVYVERGKRTGEGRTFTQAAALYNASMARTDGDKQNMVARLQETERQFLRNTCKIDCEPFPYSSALDHIKELDNMRARVKSQLDTIHQEHNPYQFDEDNPVVREVEIKRAEAIKNLFKRITIQRQQFIQVLSKECVDKLGPTPCKYAFIGLGSQATELVTPYSDLEFAILIEEGEDNDDTRRYFLNLTHYLHLKVINLGETILPAMAIPSLNDFLSEDPEKNWFFDSVTPRGFAFDGFMPWASKTPFGRDKTQTKDPLSLIQTPAELAKYQRRHIALTEGYHLSDILRRVVYLTGDESLVDEYTVKVSKSVNRSDVLSRWSVIPTLKEDIRQVKDLELTGHLLDVKKEIYRFPSVVVDLLSLSVCCGMTVSSVWRTIEELQRAGRISQEDAHHLTVLISISAELRLRTYIANGGQKDRLSPLTEMKVQLGKHDVDGTFLESVFYIPDSKMLFRYYYTSIPLKTCIVVTVLNAGPTAKIFQTDIFDTSSLTRGRMAQQLFHLDAAIRHLEAALEEADVDKERQLEIHFDLGHAMRRLGDFEKAMSHYELAFQIGSAIYGDTTKGRHNIATLVGSIGSCWSGLGNQKKAISYHEQSLEMEKAIYGFNTPHPAKAASLNNIGKCWSDLGDEKKAIRYHEQSLKMMKAIYGDKTAHPDIALSLGNIGNSWGNLGDQRKAISYYEQSLNMTKTMYGEATAHPDIAASLNNIGECWRDLGDQKKALSYHEQSLTMKKVIYGETTAHRDIASSLNNIGNCWSVIGDQGKAITYYEQSLQMLKTTYGETTAHPDIASSFNNIGKSWGDLGEYRKALSYHEQSLKIKKTFYGESTAHPDVAASLNNIATCFDGLGDLKKAMTYYEHSLQMRKTLYGETTEHSDIAASLNNIGKCWRGLGDSSKAIRFYEQSLQMMKTVYGETTEHPAIATLLNNIGTCWNVLGDLKKALCYYEESQTMRNTLYGESTAHPEIADSLNNIGSCWSDLGDSKKAINYYEQSLKMTKAIFGEKAHPDIASSLGNIGSSWSKLGDHSKAIRYHLQSLNMQKAIYGKTTAHREIASSLHNIGDCWSKLGHQIKAIMYHDYSLKMMKVVYGETTAHPDIALSLNSIGSCWSKLGDQRKAIRYFEYSMMMMKDICGVDKAHHHIALSLTNIGVGWFKLGDPSKAVSYCEQSLKMMKVLYGDNTEHPIITQVQNYIRVFRSALPDNTLRFQNSHEK